MHHFRVCVVPTRLTRGTALVSTSTSTSTSIGTGISISVGAGLAQGTLGFGHRGKGGVLRGVGRSRAGLAGIARLHTCTYIHT